LYAVEIYNQLGQLVYQESGDGVLTNNLAVDIADLNSGMYFLRVAIDDSASGKLQWLQQKFIKQ
ncbi:MAG TPA: T9SS type A sorting domain-containing protein, partial [Chitinophagales bacterium]|nr:T9SS type A sorting domain-containing protein [Chitinophagales bacterium]